LLSRWPQVRLHGAKHPRLPNTVNFALPGWRGEDLVAALDLEGIAVSSGSACFAGTVRPSHVLQAMGCARAEAEASLRVSLGKGSVEEHVGLFMGAMEKILDRARPGHARREAVGTPGREAGRSA
jgi:cysteine desulfurase